MAKAQSSDANVERIEAPADAPEGTPEAITTPAYQEPGPDVSNADVNISALSSDSAHSKVVDAPEQNPEGHYPAPGPQRVEILGTPGDDDGEPVTGQLEHTR